MKDANLDMMLASFFYRRFAAALESDAAREDMDPLQAMLEGQELVRKNQVRGGVALIKYALEGFLRGIGGSESDEPALYSLVNDCYLWLIGASSGINTRLIDEREGFFTTYNIDEKSIEAFDTSDYV